MINEKDKLKIEVSQHESIHTYETEKDDMFTTDFFEAVLRAYHAVGYVNPVTITVHNKFLGDETLTYDPINQVERGEGGM